MKGPLKRAFHYSIHIYLMTLFLNLLKAAWKWQEDFRFGRYTNGVAIVNGSYTKGLSFLPKMAYKRVRGRTSGRSLLALLFLVPPSPGTISYSMWRVFTHVIIFFHVSKKLGHTGPFMILSWFKDSHKASGSSINQRSFLNGKHCKLDNYLKYRFTLAI